MKTAFNINFRPEIEAGKFKVVTADARLEIAKLKYTV